MKRRITDLFKNTRRDRNIVKDEPMQVSQPPKVSYKSVRKRNPPVTNRHNQFQAEQANKIQKRRKKNKVAKKQRQINRKAA